MNLSRFSLQYGGRRRKGRCTTILSFVEVKKFILTLAES